jgi:hypothetical protein
MLAREPFRAGSVFAGERGERWQVARGAEASPFLAPESLLHVMRSDPDRWTFVGASGTAYQSRSPLGPFVGSAAPEDPLVRVSARDSTLLGLRQDGALVRSDDAGVSWSRVGPTDNRFADVALGPGATGLALAVPERWWTTSDHGATWQPADIAPVGAFALYQDKGQSIVVEGVLGHARFTGGASGGLTAVRALPERQKYELGVELRRGPDAGAVAEGRALSAAERYIEVAREKDSSTTWRLWRGRSDGFLDSAALPVATGCQTLRLGGFGRWLALACWRRTPTDSSEPVELFASDDGAKRWHSINATVWARYSEFDLAVGPGANLLVTGVCASADAQRGCRPRGVQYLAPAKAPRPASGTAPRLEVIPSATPAASGTASALAFSTDGRIAYAVASRSKGRAWALYVSKDRGRSFVARELGVFGPGGAPGDYEESLAYARRQSTAELSIVPADDGTVAVLGRWGIATKLWVTDDDGRLITSGAVPSGANGLGAFGARALAFSTESKQAWESLDGGTSWDDIGHLPLTLCRGDPSCRLPVVCHSSGCVIGDELSRVGWHGQVRTAERLGPRPDTGVRDSIERKVSVPMACTLGREPWQHVDGADVMPRAEQAAMGKLAWFAATADEAKGASGVVHAIGGSKAHLERVTLLGSVADHRGYARYSSLQVEGLAALRYRVATPHDPRLTDVEVGWENLVEGRVRFARLPDAGPYRPNDYESSSSGWQTARPHLVSIATGGIYLRLHASAGDAQDTWFLDGRSAAKVPPVSWSRPNGGAARTEMVHVDGQHVPVMLVGNGTALVRARPEGGSWTFGAFATGLFDPRRFGLQQTQDIGYLGARAGLQLAMHDQAETEHRAWLFPFRATGALLDAPIELPTQLDAGPRPRSCVAAERSTTPRVVMPFQAGTRHPVIVVDGTDPQRVLLTSAAVMYGTPREPCVAAWEANQVEPASGTEGQLESAILPLDDLDHAWLFRLTARDPKSSPGFDYRLMSCRFDPSLEVPSVVFQAPGTLVIHH